MNEKNIWKYSEEQKKIEKFVAKYGKNPLCQHELDKGKPDKGDPR